jgi:hypothetical protein
MAGTSSPANAHSIRTGIHLRSLATGEYFAGVGRWVKDRADAVNFESSTQAVYLVIQQRLKNVELLLAGQEIPYDIHLPVSLPEACSP